MGGTGRARTGNETVKRRCGANGHGSGSGLVRRRNFPGGAKGYCTRLMVEANTPTAIAETITPQIDAPIASGMINA